MVVKLLGVVTVLALVGAGGFGAVMWISPDCCSGLLPCWCSPAAAAPVEELAEECCQPGSPCCDPAEDCCQTAKPAISCCDLPKAVTAQSEADR